MATNILTIDLSPKGTAIAHFRDDVLDGFWFTTEVKKQAKSSRALLLDKVKRGEEVERIERVDIVERWIFEDIIEGCELQGNEIEYCCLEDYVWNAPPGKSGGVIQTAELGGVIRLRLLRSEIQTRTFEPLSVKLFWAGNGKADKREMIQVAKEVMAEQPERFPHAKEILALPDSCLEGVCDALALGEMLITELKVIAGLVSISDLPRHQIRIFNRVTKAVPFCLVDRPFF